MNALTAPEIIADLYDVFERRALARLMGINETTLYRWQTGAIQPKSDRLDALCRLRDLLPEIRQAARSSRAERLIA